MPPSQRLQQKGFQTVWAHLKNENILPFLTYCSCAGGREDLRRQTRDAHQVSKTKGGHWQPEAPQWSPSAEQMWTKSITPNTGKREPWGLEWFSTGLCCPHLQSPFLLPAVMGLLTAAMTVWHDFCSSPLTSSSSLVCKDLSRKYLHTLLLLALLPRGFFSKRN